MFMILVDLGYLGQSNFTHLEGHKDSVLEVIMRPI